MNVQVNDVVSYYHPTHGGWRVGRVVEIGRKWARVMPPNPKKSKKWPDGRTFKIAVTELHPATEEAQLSLALDKKRRSKGVKK